MKFIRLRSRRERKGKSRWISITSTNFKERYLQKKKQLEDVGIDYRVWMDANDPDMIKLRDFLENYVDYRIRYNFYVKKRDYKEACRVLNIDRRGLLGQGIDIIFF